MSHTFDNSDILIILLRSFCSLIACCHACFIPAGVRIAATSPRSRKGELLGSTLKFHNKETSPPDHPNHQGPPTSKSLTFF